MTTIKKERKKRKLTQRGLSKILGLSSDYIGFLERRTYNTSVKVAAQIAEYFGLRIEDFEEFKG
jgi:DNA-binding XRE family transcriptional regulator